MRTERYYRNVFEQRPYEAKTADLKLKFEIFDEIQRGIMKFKGTVRRNCIIKSYCI